jgi:MFS family permease
VAGPLLAVAFMALFAGDIRAVLWVAVVPAGIAVAVLVFCVREPPTATTTRPARQPIRAAHLRRLGTGYWWLLAVAGTLTLARFSEAFLILRAADVGLALAFVPPVMVVMNVVYALSAYPAGRLSDAVGRRGLLAGGMALLIAGDVVLALAPDFEMVMAGVVLWGLHMGLTQGIFAAMVADMAPEALRGTAFGIYNLAGGAALLLASVLAGWLWDVHGPAATFIAGAVFAALALAGLLAAWRRLGPRAPT